VSVCRAVQELDKRFLRRKVWLWSLPRGDDSVAGTALFQSPNGTITSNRTVMSDQTIAQLSIPSAADQRVLMDGLRTELSGVQHSISVLDPGEDTENERPVTDPSVVDLITTQYRVLRELRGRRTALRQSIRLLAPVAVDEGDGSGPRLLSSCHPLMSVRRPPPRRHPSCP
jgi:hypothetical protein